MTQNRLTSQAYFVSKNGKELLQNMNLQYKLILKIDIKLD